MENISFVIWMIVYPLGISISSHLSGLRGIKYDDDVIGLAAVLDLIIWVGVGKLLYVG